MYASVLLLVAHDSIHSMTLQRVLPHTYVYVNAQ